jgi:hypothetical protein
MLTPEKKKLKNIEYCLEKNKTIITILLGKSMKKKFKEIDTWIKFLIDVKNGKLDLSKTAQP